MVTRSADALRCALMSTLQLTGIATTLLGLAILAVILFRRKARPRSAAPLPRVASPALSATALQFLNHALNAHGIPSVIKDGATRIIAAPLLLEPQVFDVPTQTPAAALGALVQLDVRAESPHTAPRFILESFAGVGDSPAAALQDAIQKFLSGTFHVVVTALAGHHCESEQTEWLDWPGAGAGWRVCAGGFMVHGDATTDSSYPEFFHELETLFRARASAGPHWVRVFVASLNGTLTAAEVMLDNEPWKAAEALVRKWNWQPPSGYRSLRHFFIALPK